MFFYDESKRSIKYLTVESIKERSHHIPLESGHLIDRRFEINFSLSNTIFFHERRSGTFFAWLSGVGGLRDAMMLIMSPLIAYYSSLKFSLSITNDMPAAFGTSSIQ